MFLKKLQIIGFKSFAKKTTLDFSSSGVFANGKNIGITAIVGPNGSGKSNVADALRWAMGEQSMKNLRGKKSQDIIFAGSGKKSQLGSAQVSIFLDNKDRKIPIDFEEVIITRKVYRSGEGEYLINGSRVRLIDVIDFLAKAGVGQRSYCIINQGMADQVLSASPLERRQMIEEAAGVKEFQVKKDRSERKLKNTKINLEKVRSLLVEIEPHLRLLKKQSQKAQKGEKYRTELKEKQNALFGFLWNSFESSRSHAQQKKDELGHRMMQRQRELDGLRDKIQGETKKSSDIGDQIAQFEKEEREKSRLLNDVERKLIIEEGKLELEKERMKNIEKIEVIPVGSEFVKKRISEIKTDQDALIKRISQTEKIEELSDLKAYAMEISKALYELFEGIARGRIEKKKPDNELERQKTVNLKNVQGFMDRIKAIRDEKNSLIRDIVQVREKLEQSVAKDRQERKAAIELEDRIRRNQFDLEKLKDIYNDAKIELAKFEVREEDLLLRIRNEMNTTPDKIHYNGERIDSDQFERDISRLKMQLEQIGGIDETILEEYDETQKRFDFLQKESEDLRNAMSKLKDIVKEMDKKIKDKFENTFKKINKEFDNYFKIIFGGGKAELTKVEIRMRPTKEDGELPEDAAEADIILEHSEEEEEVKMGIDIVASPAGKRITNLGMLSGGERSLTSIALIFAIISHNPPPFAILDEVEAALDEANSKRFGKILHELSGKTQFVLITHNRQIMREASLLYGVTMTDDGTSKLLSVRLDQVGNKGEIKE